MAHFLKIVSDHGKIRIGAMLVARTAASPSMSRRKLMVSNKATG
jgi:hypothetical protein